MSRPSGRWAGWIGDALEPREAEVRAVVEGMAPELREALASATAPTEAEVARLLRRRPAAAPARGASWGWVAMGGLALAGAAAAVLLWPAPDPGYGLVEAPLDVAQALPPGVRLELGPSIDVLGEGTFVVEAAGEGGTAVRVVDGRVRFEVEPGGAYRALTVRAEDVAVSVVGTVFDVERGADGVAVSVERGRVAVRWPEGEVFVSGGGAWTRPGVVADAAPVPGDAPAAAVAPPVELTVEPAEARTLERPARGAAGAGEASSAPVMPSDRPAAAPVADAAIAAPGAEGTADAGLLTPGTAFDEIGQLLHFQATGLAGEPLLREIDGFLARHGAADEAGEAEILRLQTLASVDPGRGADAMRAWLDAHPGSDREALIRYDLARVTHRELGRCASALPDYRAVADADRGFGAQAAAGAGLCAGQLGAGRLAEEYLRLALERGLEGPLRAEVEAALAASE